MRTRTAVGGSLCVAVAAATFGRLSNARADDVPLSPLRARGRIGGDWVTREGVGTGEEPAGEMDDMAEFARPDFDPDAVAPAVRHFYERTSEYDATLTAEWHRPFRTGAWLASLVTSRLEQLNLPAPADDRVVHLDNRLERLDPTADPRNGARAWIRTDADTGEGVFVAMYATHTSEARGTGDGDEDERFVNIAVPLPFANLSTVLSMHHLGDAGAVELTTESAGDPGLFLVTPLGQFRLPMRQRFRVWPVDAPDAPEPPEPGADVVATHEMWLFGRQFLTVRYGLRRRGEC
ncbi:hypothetical protein [Haloarchaeobius sp. DFWS5]|uniref:hypothetical protein n=1 Tax=Haloarchaeobius sp. DFWS5 TaxID=3446114 RepID=UPI003EBF314F